MRHAGNMENEPNLKNNILDRLRLQIASFSSVAKETPRAEADLLAVSFQSAVIPRRHVWISIPTEASHQFLIDLEDWDYEATWDNSVAHVEAATLSAATTVCSAWLDGKDVGTCLGA